MPQATMIDVKEVVLSNSSFGPQEVRQLATTLTQDSSQYRVLRDAVDELSNQEGRTPAMAVRLGVCLYLLGRYQRATDTLKTGDGGALALFYQGRCQFALGNYSQAADLFRAAQKAGYDADTCALAVSEAVRYTGDATGALALLDKLSGAIEQTAEYLYQRGSTVSALGGNPSEVVALFERAVSVDGAHPGALFGLAMETERRGNDLEALSLYQKATNRLPAHVGSLMNLGILYEDMGQYERSRQCYQRVLEHEPNNLRARLFLRDAEASRDMFYDEEAQRNKDRIAQVLSLPVSDFELSVRSRNCLQKMGITTLGDLARVSEQELLASKNFGETSLVEIRDMLGTRGLTLGQFAHERREDEVVYDPETLPADQKVQLDRPISDLNLSVRARKCMARLGINSLGELVRRTGDDLLECKNFGVTSLNEVREKLTAMSLKLRGD